MSGNASRVFVTFLIVVALFLVGYYFYQKSNSMTGMACANPPRNIIAFGDSLVSGYGATRGKDLPSLLSTRLGVPVLNMGRSGDTTAEAQGRLSRVLSEHPDVVLIVLGGNDVLQGVPMETTKSNLASMIETLQRDNIEVVLAGVMGGLGNDPFYAMFQDLSKSYGVALVPNILNGVFGHQDLMSDQIHPNDAGYAKVADKITPAIAAACDRILRQ